MTQPAATKTGDITGRPLRLFLFYGLPTLTIMASGSLAQGPRSLGLIIAGGFAVMGALCVANAWRCGRTHCFFTGPWFLLFAAASLLKGFGIIPWEWLSWNLIANGGLVGAAVLWCVSEPLLGRYHPFHSGPE